MAKVLPRRSAALAVLAAALTASPLRAEMLAVSVQQANVRASPGVRSPVLWRLWIYNPLEVLDRQGNWLQVTDFFGEEGWVHESVVARIPAVQVAAEAANVREGPGARRDTVWEVDQGYPFMVQERRGNWLKVKDDGKISGWIHVSTVWGVTDPGAYRGGLGPAASDPG